MGNWRVAVGNAVARAPQPAAAVAPSASSSLYPLEQIGDGHPDEAGRFAQHGLALYEAELDLSLLAQSSPKSDAPTGWGDLTLHLAGTPGLATPPPDWGSYFGRSAFRAFWPSFQDFDVIPGEALRLRGGGYIDAGGGSAVTELRAKVTNLRTGREWDGVGAAWVDNGNAWTTITLDAWVDFDVSIPWESLAPDERSTYRVTLYGLVGAAVAGGPAADFHFAAHGSDPAGAVGPGIFVEQDFVALVGHNVPRGSLVEWVPQIAGTPWTVPVVHPTAFYQDPTPVAERVWRLRITVPEPSFVEAPYVGELWAGPLTELAWCPAFPFDLTVDDPGQVRAAGGYGRANVFSDAARDRVRLRMNFDADDAGYQQARYFLEGATRHGADPLLILPVDSLEGADAIYHARLTNEVAYSRRNNARRRYTLRADEDPFPRF